MYTTTVTVSGNGNYITTNTAVAKQTGVYYWTATYSGDVNNNGASSTGKPGVPGSDPNERATVIALHSTGKTRTLGYWANQGNSSITQTDINYLNTLYLRKADGTRYTITGTLAQERASLATFLNSASATNMANMLSAQLIATYLNTSHGLVTTSTYVYVGGIQLNSYLTKVGSNADGSGGASIVNANGFVLIGDLLSVASDWLKSFGNTVTSNYARSAEEAFKNVFDAINSDKSIFLI